MIWWIAGAGIVVFCLWKFFRRGHVEDKIYPLY